MPMTPDDDTFEARKEDALEQTPPPLGLSDMVRESPVGALIGAFAAGFLIARLL